MSEFQESDAKRNVLPALPPKTPVCPLCTRAMALKKVHRQAPRDHFIFHCADCKLEYPVLGHPRP